MVMPGDNTDISVKLIQPVAMDEGLRFAIREGGRTVGAAGSPRSSSDLGSSQRQWRSPESGRHFSFGGTGVL